MQRRLSDTFMNNLLAGSLKEILEYIHNDHTLDIEIRENYINIYYRGGNILRVTEKKPNVYAYEQDHNYIKSISNKSIIKLFASNCDWDNYFPYMKQAMDFYFSHHSKEEREYQQLVVRENNYSKISNSTDYFIIDIEYDNHKRARFDLIAIEWPSEGAKRKLSKNFRPKLVVIEMKYADKALGGSAGMKKHLDDFNSFLSDTKSLNDFTEEMLGIFKQKRVLGLIPCLSTGKNSNNVEKFADAIDMAFLLANHDPASKNLKRELLSCGNMPARFIASNYMGYGIFNHSIYTMDEFIGRYKNQFHEF